MTSRDLTENVEQLQIRGAPAARARPRGRRAGPAGRARGRSYDRPRHRRAHPQRRRRRRPRWASGSRRAADELLVAYERLDGPASPATRCAASRARSAPPRTARPARRRRRPGWPSSSGGSPSTSGFTRVLDQRRPGVPALARPRRRQRAGPAGRRAVQPGHDDPADGRPRAGHRGLQARPGRLVGDAAQDEHPLLRAGQRASPSCCAATCRWSASWPATSGTRATSSCSVVRRVALPDAFFAARRAVRDVPHGARRVRRVPGGDRARAGPLPAVPRHDQGADGGGAQGRRPRDRARGDQGARGRRRAARCASRAPSDNDLFDRLAADPRLGLDPRRARRAGGRAAGVHRRRRRPGGRAVAARVEAVVAAHPEAAGATRPAAIL